VVGKVSRGTLPVVLVKTRGKSKMRAIVVDKGRRRLVWATRLQLPPAKLEKSQ
jgi:hypothetical protein